MLISFYPFLNSTASAFIVAVPWGLGLAYLLVARRTFDVPLALLSIPMLIYGFSLLALMALLEVGLDGSIDLLPFGLLLAVGTASGLGIAGMVMLARGCHNAEPEP